MKLKNWLCRNCFANLTLAAAVLLVLSNADPLHADTPTSCGPGRTTQGLKGGDPVFTNSGAFGFSIPLLRLAGPLPLDVDLHYRTDNYNWLGLGAPTSWQPEQPAHFQHSFLPSMEGNPNAEFLPELAAETTRSGELVTFDINNGIPVLREPSPTRYVAKYTARFLYLMDPIRGHVYVFQRLGSWDNRTIALMDRNSNRWLYSFLAGTDRYPTGVSDGLGRSLAFTFVNRDLTTVTDQNNRSIVYAVNVDPNNRCYNSVTDPMGQVTTFKNAGACLITGVQRPLGNTPYTQVYGQAMLNAKTEQRVASQSDAYQNKTTFVYDPTKNRVTMTAPDGTVTVFGHFGNDGPPQSFTDPTGKAGAFTRTAQDQINGFTDRLGDTTAITYHAPTGKIASVTDAKGQTRTYTYTAQDQEFTNPADPSDQVTFTFYNLTRIDHPDGTNQQFTYDSRGNLLTHVDQAGHTWTFTYNARGQVLTETNPAGGVVTNTYNADATLATTTDSDGVTRTFTYDAYKRLQKITHPDTTFTEITYNLNDQITSIRDENGHVYTYAYDANGNGTAVTDPRGNQTQYAYDLIDRVTQMTDRLGRNTIVTYDNMGRTASTTDRNGLAYTFGYDQRGWQNRLTRGGQTVQAGHDDEAVLASGTTPLGHVATYQSDKLGNRTGVINPLGQATTFSYDSLSRPTGITDPLSRTTTFSYDPRGLLSAVNTPGIGTATYARNNLGQVNNITDLNGQNWTFGHTGMGRASSLTDPLGNTTNFTYDTRGRQTQWVFPDGTTSALTYDSSDNVLREQYSGGLDLQFTYSALDQMLSANGIGFTRDPEGRITSTDNPGTVFGATYDNGGRLATATYNNGAFTVTYAYDPANGLLSRVTDNLTNAQLDFTYDADERLAGVTRSNGVDTTYTYDNADRLNRIQDGAIIDLKYTRDAAGQVTEADVTIPLDPATLLSTGTQTFTYGAASQISTAGYAYDPRGRQTDSPGRTYGWDGASRLTSIGAAALTYNGLGDLVTRSSGQITTHFYYNYALALNPIVAEKNETTGDFLRYYVWAPDGALLYMIDGSDGNKVYFYHFDRTGSTLALTNSAGAVTDSYAYTPYGKVLGHTGASTQPFTFVGQWGVREEGAVASFYQMRARYYDAQTARFLSRDPVWPRLSSPGELNPYQYALGDPAAMIDPTGTVPSSTQSDAFLAFFTGSIFTHPDQTLDWLGASAFSPQWDAGNWESTLVITNRQVLPQTTCGRTTTCKPVRLTQSSEHSTGDYLKGGKKLVDVATGVTLLKGNKTLLEKGFATGAGKIIKETAKKSPALAGKLISVGGKIGPVVKAAGPVGIAISGMTSSHEIGTWIGEGILHGPDAAAAKAMENSITADVVGALGDRKYVGIPIRAIGSVVSWLCGD
ncbi:MAG: RHS repeat protein [Acidobacteria bacterium]|nr:MAG: RHS repeat protein [Acidobacteriota bacterium]